MVWAYHIRQVFVEPLFIMNFIKNSRRKKDEMSPDFFQPEHFRKPFFAAEQNQENRVENKEGDDGIDEKKASPKPLKWK